MDKDIPGVPQRNHPVQVFLGKYLHPFQAVHIKGASCLGIAFQGQPAENGFQANPGLHKVFHGLVLFFAQLFSGGAKLPVKMIAFFIAADDLVGELF